MLQPEQKKTALKQAELVEVKANSIQQQPTIIPPMNPEKSKQINEGMEILYKPTYQQDNINPALLKKKRQKKRKLGL